MEEVDVENIPSQKRTPIIRKPGEVVFLKHMRPAKESTPIIFEKELIQQNNIEEEITLLNDSDETSAKLDRIGEKLNQVENKLDELLASLQQQDVVLRTLKQDVKQMQNGMRDTTTQQESFTSVTEGQPSTKRKRKFNRLVSFPISDDFSLLRLEEQILTDEEVREEVINRFHEAPTNSVYEYLRKNIECLLLNTSKYTWTGKQTRPSSPTQQANAASSLQVVELLLTCCMEVFPKQSRNFIEKECRRSLQNFNDSMINRTKRRQEKMSRKFEVEALSDE
ncbi:uncharacterized protein LOC129729668 [Wyeomyia smithii]|uniref:uncharacterized protein LOC129729668 n=1 Tax=Wyeomyia smithii TaxID=174621 RepID=UPI002467F530|nr:uncharacterized protein LOC129729668 [Wyeomyia smithii]